ncbi:MAG: hypothetical protein QOK40_2315 [Miltoncostaeaceae bacterium]|jgi:hypothetical protein|nr:hypothetical protein [Miltoncostaeaceae bacterium]
MTRWVLASLALLLALPTAAFAAREPVISYVHKNADGTGVLHLWDEQTEAEVEPPPVLVPNADAFRYGMSLDGRYIVFNDADNKLHLLDRATNAQIPLPGIDVYANPGGLTVSNTGLIAFDQNGNGPALVYNSATGAFVDVGFADNNGHRQTRLSGNGLFLGTTCNDSNCVDDLDMGADPYVQDLSARLDTGFPNDATADEEHACLDGDGSVFGFDKRRSAAKPKRDIFLLDRSVSPPQPIDIAPANDADMEEVRCVLDSSGEFVGLFNNTTAAFGAFDIVLQKFLMLPPAHEFNEFSLFSEPYSPPPPPPPLCCTPPQDVTNPEVKRFRMTHRRFRPGRGATKFRFRLSEAADVRIVVRRRRLHGHRMGTIKRDDLPAGANAITFSGRLRGHRLRPRRYVAILTATDAAGNVSLARSIRFTVLRAGGDRRH